MGDSFVQRVIYNFKHDGICVILKKKHEGQRGVLFSHEVAASGAPSTSETTS